MDKTDRKKIHIGTSGWHYLHWRNAFYPAEMSPAYFLDYYKNCFPTVEINNSFYRLPQNKTLKTWSKKVPPDFIFSVKASRYITHIKRLKDPRQSTAKLFKALKWLGGNLGPILFQLPPRWRCDPNRLDEFLNKITKGYRYVFEFRDPGWFSDEIYRILKAHRACFCIYELKGVLSPLEITADFVYVRLHGPGGAYQGCYSDAELRQWAEKILAWHSSKKEVFFYFDNDEAGYAAKNAIRLTEILNS